jgi:hypothetical protein
MLLKAEEREWLMPHKAMFLLGTEAPDNSSILEDCETPNQGYGDTGSGHNVRWKSDWSGFKEVNGVIKNRAALRAQEEYNKAIIAYYNNKISDAAFYLGAMAHYIGDVTVYCHVTSYGDHHSGYERWGRSRTDDYCDGTFESYIETDNLTRRTPYTAVKRTSRATAKGKGGILSASSMDSKYSNKDDEYFDSVGHSLNLGVNELADVLYTFYLNIVKDNP